MKNQKQIEERLDSIENIIRSSKELGIFIPQATKAKLSYEKELLLWILEKENIIEGTQVDYVGTIQEKILTLLSNESNLSVSEISNKLGIYRNNLQMPLRKLIKKKLIISEGIGGTNHPLRYSINKRKKQ